MQTPKGVWRARGEPLDPGPAASRQDLRAGQQTKDPVAIYHLSVKPVSRSAGRSATAAAAYRAAERIDDSRLRMTFDYTRRGGVVASAIAAPAGCDWAEDREALWNAAEAAESRKNSQTAREIEIALPHELTPDQREALIGRYAQELIDAHGVAVDACIHAPHKHGSDERAHHAHLLLTTRRVTASGFGEKTREWDDRKTGPETVLRWRERWADLCNQALAEAGHHARIDHRTLEAQGITDRLPQTKLGPGALAFERKTGEKSRRREWHEERAAEFAQEQQELAALHHELTQLDEEIEQRRQAEAKRAEEEARQAAELARQQAEQARREEEARQAAEERQRAAEAAKRAEEERRQAEARKPPEERLSAVLERLAALDRQHPRYRPVPAVQAAWERHTRAGEALDVARREYGDEVDAQEARNKLMRPLFAGRVRDAEEAVFRAEQAMERALEAATAASQRHKASPAYLAELAEWERQATGLAREQLSIEREIQMAIAERERQQADELGRFKTEINLVEYAQAQGYEVIKRESSQHSVALRRLDGDKIVVATDADGHGIYFGVRGERDSGTIIDFVQRRQGLSLGQVRKELRGWVPGSAAPAPRPAAPCPRPKRSSADQARMGAELALAWPAQRHAYLEGRGIAPDTLADPRFDVRQGQRGEAIFPHWNRAGACGYEVKNQGFTGFSAGGEKGLWLSRNAGTAPRIVVCESAIDALSHAQLHPDPTAAYVSFGGSMSPAQVELMKSLLERAHERGADLVLATDADPKGREYTDQIAGMAPEGMTIYDHPPEKGKDWNEALQLHLEQQPDQVSTDPGYEHRMG